MKNFTLFFLKALRFKSNLSKSKFVLKLIFVLAGIGSTIWFLIRVIPKPQRATYPCMQAAAPFMSAFVIYLISLMASISAWKFAKAKFQNRQFIVASALIVVSVVAFAVFFATPKIHAFASTNSVQIAANAPVGTPTGYFAGRVVWVYDANATDKNCSNDSWGNYWFQKTDQTVVDKMLADGFKAYSEETTVAKSWDNMFKHFNQKKGKGWLGYTAGEKICIKLNLTNTSATGYETAQAMDATPQICLALLHQLVDSVGVAQADITIGDPFRTFSNAQFDICYDKYPNVHYIDGFGGNGREQTVISDEDLYKTSDGFFTSPIPQAFVDADYLINMPCLKSHDAAGVTITAKNHQGSVLGYDDDGNRQEASNQAMGILHYCYPASDGVNKNTKQYRHLVDYMGNKYMGGNTLVFVVDALWCGYSWYGTVQKWGMAPFGNDYPSSIFVTQDQVAMECVGFDFLHDEYNTYPSNHGDKLPLMNNDNGSVQDYALQAASKAYWPAGITYTDGSGTEIGSLGVFEHWNGMSTKQYSVNLTGEKGGIHLVSVPANLVATVPIKYSHDADAVSIPDAQKIDIKLNVYPNPVTDNLTIDYFLLENSEVSINIFDISGKLVKNVLSSNQTMGQKSINTTIDNLNLSRGTYLCTVRVNNVFSASLKINVTN